VTRGRTPLTRTSASSAATGRTLIELDLHARTGVLLLAVRRSPDSDLLPNPPGDLVVTADAVLIALGSLTELADLETFVGNLVES